MVTTNPALDRLGDYPLAGLQDLAERLRDDGEALYDFSIGDPDEPTPQFIRDALVAAVGPVSRYPTAAGRSDLRAAVAAWVQRRHGVAVDPDAHVLASSGSKEAIFHLPFVVVDADGPRRGVVWGDPGYPVYERGALLAGGVSRPVRLDHASDWLLDLRDVDGLDDACIAWLNYPHNPTGAAMPLDVLRAQVEVAREHGVLLCTDECYTDVWFDAPAPSVLEACDGDLTGVVAFVSLSKRSGMTGYRSGAIIGDADVIGRLRLLRPNVGTASPAFVQAAALAAWTDDAHVEERRAIFAAKREVVLSFLDAVGIEVSGSVATFYVWLRAPGGDDLAYVEALVRERILTSPGRSFGPAGSGWIRLALVPTIAECEAAVARWGEAIGGGRLPA